MSFSKEKREQIKRYLLEKIKSDQKDMARKTAEAFSISLNTVYRYIRELEDDGIIEQREKKYLLKSDSYTMVLYRNKSELMEEDTIYNKYVKRFVEKFPANIQKIWEYSFMEMMNNVIDHSEADRAIIYVSQNYLDTNIMIWDNGIGIFKKIKEYYNYSSLDDAVNELFKGKLTTDSKNHSGEGIFFTSRALDEFAAISDGKIFTHDKYYEILGNLEDILQFEQPVLGEGTIIAMQLSNFSNKILSEVFDMFADEEGGFIRTHIPIKNIYETYPVSRSQAKRLCNRFEKFEEIELDFKEVDEIGQGFAHEIFVVFHNQYPEVKLIPVNMNHKVEKMINHVKQTVN